MLTGSLIANRFDVQARAGSGGMSTVYQALDRHSGTAVAVKVLQPSQGRERERFHREARILAGMSHPGIVRYVAHGDTPSGEGYLAMEWLEGQVLSGRLMQGPLSVPDTLELAKRVTSALAAAHQAGVLHRDIKPTNLFLVHGDVRQAKVLDFGIARGGNLTPHTTVTGLVLGTPGYMAPEQARGERDVDARADIFSLGCVLFECLAGQPPFRGRSAMAVLAKILLEDAPPIRSFCPDLPPGWERLLERMLRKSPEQRPADLRELLALLESLDGPTSLPHLTELPAPSLTCAEQRLVCVIFVRCANNSDSPLATLRATAATYGGAVESLADGAHVVILSGSTEATDQAIRGAGCAGALQALLPGASVALATGRATLAGRLSLGELLDRCAGLLEPPTTSLRLDDVTAGLLAGRFPLPADSAAPARTLLGRPTPCVGREPELAGLEAIFTDCVTERTVRAVRVTAPPGAGKSRLRQELIERLRKRGAPIQVWVGRGDPMKAGSPFGIIADALRQAVGAPDGEPLASRQHALMARVGGSQPPGQAQRVAEFLGELVGTPFSDESSVQLRAARRDPMLLGDQMRRAFEDFVRGESLLAPVVLALEDLHWGDLPTVKLIDGVLRDLTDCPVLILALARPEVESLFPHLWAERGVYDLRLGELTRKASQRLAREVLGEKASSATIERVASQAAGNAFYLEELIRAVAEGRDEALPGTVLAMAQTRLERLDPDARRILRAASIFGRVFWRGGVQALLGAAPLCLQLDEWLSVWVGQELIATRPERRFPGEQEYAFRHELLREAAYATLTDEDRALGHRLAGEWLERSGPPVAVELAEHFERGGRPERALSWYQRAASLALEGDDLEASLRRVERAIGCGARDDVLGELRFLEAEARHWRGEHARVEVCAAHAMACLPRGSAGWCGAVGLAADACGKLGLHEPLMRLGEALLALPQADQMPAEEVVALVRTIAQLILAGSLPLARCLMERLEQFASSASAQGLQHREPAVAAWIDHARSILALFQGDLGLYVTLKKNVVEGFERSGDRRNELAQRAKLGYGLREIGAYRESEAALQQAVEKARRSGLHQITASAQHNLGLALLRLGKLEEARAVEQEAVDAFSAHGDRRLETASRLYMGLILVELGNLDAALDAVHRGQGLAVPGSPAMAHALAILAHVHLARGEASRALPVAEDASALLARLGGMDEGESMLRLVYARALLAAGRDARAREALCEARRRVLERAGKISDSAWRRCFLEDVPENRHTLSGS